MTAFAAATLILNEKKESLSKTKIKPSKDEPKSECDCVYTFTSRDNDFDWYTCMKCGNRVGKCRSDKEDFS